MVCSLFFQGCDRRINRVRLWKLCGGTCPKILQESRFAVKKIVSAVMLNSCLPTVCFSQVSRLVTGNAYHRLSVLEQNFSWLVATRSCKDDM